MKARRTALAAPIRARTAPELPIGRAAELAFLVAALERSPLLYVHGVAGEGKTTLLSALATAAIERGMKVERLDGGVLADSALEDRIRSIVGAKHKRVLLVLDHWESMHAHDAWLASVLPKLDRLVIAIGSRLAPSLALRAAIPRADRWELALESLDGGAAHELLARAGVPREHREQVVAWTHGHALSLVVLADAAARMPLSTVVASGEGRHLLSRLLSAFLAGVERADERRAIETIALLRYVTEEELHHVPGIDPARVGRLFRFLRERSFVRSAHLGLTLHDALRELIVDDFVWRNPTAARSVVRSALALVRSNLVAEDDRARQRAIENVPEILARAPRLSDAREAIKYEESGIGIATEEEHRVVAELVRRHEGAEAARICTRWMALFPALCRVRRNDRGSIIAVTVRGLVDRRRPNLLEDPLLERVFAETERRGLGPRVLVNRFFFDREGDQVLGPDLAPLMEAAIRSTMTMTFDVHVSVLRDLSGWQPLMQAIGVEVLTGAETRIGEVDLTPIFTTSTSTHPANQGFVEVTARAWGIDPAALGETTGGRTGMGREEGFASDVRRAVEAINDVQELSRSTLVHRLPGAGSATNLRAMLEAAIESTRAMRTGVHRALVERRANERSLLDAAAASAMSLATYKRHYKMGIDRVVELLWETAAKAAESEGEETRTVAPGD